jgi:hypothetical protein
MTSAIIAAARSIVFAITNSSHGLVLTAPNSVPVSPASSPSPAYAAARPSTYVSASVMRAVRRRAPTPPPTIETVIGIIG